mmetsp:Transcript_84169/g.132921  ORF Transcript_84169/g.132921 Transcript_84169/m.132921 type:complete len:308 (-) Transcript_84169:101-1024(-)
MMPNPQLTQSQPGTSSSPSSGSKTKASRSRNGGGRQARGRGGGQTGCTGVGGPSFCVVEAKNAMTKLVREAAGLPKQKQSKGKSPKSKSLGSPRSEASSASNGNTSTGSFTKQLRELFNLGTFREKAGDESSVDARPFRWDGAKLHEKWGDYEYDEELQEDLFLERVFYPTPVVNTFIHYRNSPEGDKEWLSSPGKLLQKSFHTKWPNHEEAHNKGICKPCAYYVYKNDGCRWGNDCQFCHLCKRGEIKKRKKEKAKFLRELREERRRVARENGENGSGESPFSFSDELPEDSESDDSDDDPSKRGT